MTDASHSVCALVLLPLSVVSDEESLCRGIVDSMAALGISAPANWCL